MKPCERWCRKLIERTGVDAECLYPATCPEDREAGLRALTDFDQAHGLVDPSNSKGTENG